MTQLLHIADRVLNRPLMIMPEKLALIAEVLAGRIGLDAAGLSERMKSDGAAAAYGLDTDGQRGVRKPFQVSPDGVAIIPVLGSLINRGSWMDAVSGVTSYEKLKFQVGEASRDASVSGVLLDIDSPGGEAVGCFEVADAVRGAAALKPVTAVVNGLCCSAAYAIASGATKIVTTRSGISGSIGVVMLHADYSHKLHEAGVVPTLIHAGAHKVDGNPYEKLTDEVKAELKGEIERFNDLFIGTVADHRKGLSANAIRAMEAKTYLGADAVKVGLADSVGSFEAALAELSKLKPATRAPSPIRRISSMSENEEARIRMEGHAAGVSAERSRIAAIVGLPEARGREAQALKVESVVRTEGVITVRALPGSEVVNVTSRGDVKLGTGATTVGGPSPGPSAN